MQRSLIGKISQKKQNWNKWYPCREYTKGNNYRTQNAVHGSFHNNNLGKDKSYIDIIRTNPKKIKKYNTANSTEEKNEKNQKKVQDWEEKLETISTKPSDTNTDVTKRVYVIGGSIVKHIRDYELSQWMENCKIFVKSFSAAKVRCI